MGVLDAPPTPKKQLDSLYATHFEVQKGGSGVVAIGDSITAADADTTNFIVGNGWLTWMALASKGRMRIIRNSGIAGQASPAMLARFDADVLAYKPNVVLIATGTNDLTPATDTLPSIEGMIKKAKAAGCAVALLTPPPGSKPATASPGSITAVPVLGTGTLAAASYDYSVVTVVAGGAGQAEVPVALSTFVTVNLSAVGSVQLTWQRRYGDEYRWYIYRRVTGSGTAGWARLTAFGSGYSRNDINPWFTDDGTLTPAIAPSTSDQIGSGNATGTLLSAATRSKLLLAHRAILALGRKYGLPVVDQRSLLIDPATGTYRVGMTVDGTHPTPRVQRIMGQNAWNILQDLFPQMPAYLVDDPSETITVLGQLTQAFNGTTNVAWSKALLPTNSVFSSQGTLSPAVPKDWDNFGGAAVTIMGNNDPEIAGNYLTVQPSTWAQTHFMGMPITIGSGVNAGWSIGDRIRVAFKIKVTGLDLNGGSLSVGLKTTGGSPGYIGLLQPAADIPNWAIWTAEGVVPAGTTQLYFQFNVGGVGVSASIGQITLDNLTAQGLAI
jgi:hypothetical protein